MIHKTKAYREAQAKKVTNLWQDPNYRANLVKKQMNLGYRQYPVKAI